MFHVDLVELRKLVNGSLKMHVQYKVRDRDFVEHNAISLSGITGWLVTQRERIRILKKGRGRDSHVEGNPGFLSRYFDLCCGSVGTMSEAI